MKISRPKTGEWPSDIWPDGRTQEIKDRDGPRRLKLKGGDMPPATKMVTTKVAEVAESEFIGYSPLLQVHREQKCFRCPEQIEPGGYMRLMRYSGARDRPVHSWCIPWQEALGSIV